MELYVNIVLVCVDREAVVRGGAVLGRGSVVKSLAFPIPGKSTVVTGITGKSIDYKQKWY